MSGAHSQPTGVSAAELVVQRVRLRLALARSNDSAAAREIEQHLGTVEAHLNTEVGKHRTRLCALFELSEAERDCLDSAVAVAVEPALGTEIAALQGLPGRNLPTEISLRLLFGHGPAPVLRPNRPLLAWGMVRRIVGLPGEPAMIEADPAMVDWYFGAITLEQSDGMGVRVPVVPENPLEEWAVEASAQRIRRVLESKQHARVAIIGQPGTGRATLAACLAKALGRKAIAVDPATSHDGETHAALQRLQRLALLGQLALIWRRDPAYWPAVAAMVPLQFVTLEPDVQLAAVEGLVDLTLRVPPLTTASRDLLLERFLPAVDRSTMSPVRSPRISDIVEAAAQQVRTADELHAVLHQRTLERTRGIGSIKVGNYTWDDLVLPEPTKVLLQGIELEARQREHLLASGEIGRLFSGAASLTALFSGPPGTGKSMSGQVVANALGLDLLYLDAATITSKYIGETAKNLVKAFDLAREASCAIMIEEADGFFSKRTDEDTFNAKSANADIGLLLQLMERHPSLILLSTNRRARIDPAFTRRLRFIVEFPMPERRERETLWDRMLQTLGLENQEARQRLAASASAFELTPAQIKSAALSTAYALQIHPQRPFDLDLLKRAIQREYTKEGRLANVNAPIPPAARSPRHVD